MKGTVGVGYRLFNEVFLGMTLKPRHVINDYAIIKNKNNLPRITRHPLLFENEKGKNHGIQRRLDPKK